MLSFIQEQEFENAEPNAARNSRQQSDSQMQKSPPIGKTDADYAEQQEQEYLTVSVKDKNVRKSTILLIALFGTGLLCLWFMIKKSAPQTTAAATAGTEEAQIEKAITQLTGVRSELFSRMDEIVRKFYEFSDVRQIKVNELVKNPFEYELFLGNIREFPDTKEGNSDADAEMHRQQQLRQQTEKMQLLSIMQSQAGNCCMIDDEILYEGDSIRGLKVSQIGDNFVKLKWPRKHDEGLLQAPSENEDTEIILKLSE